MSKVKELAEKTTKAIQPFYNANTFLLAENILRAELEPLLRGYRKAADSLYGISGMRQSEHEELLEHWR